MDLLSNRDDLQSSLGLEESSSRVADRFLKSAGYQNPAADLAGVRTVVDEKPAKGINDPLGDSIYHAPGETWKSDRERADPETNDNNYDLTREPKPPPVYNVPGPAVSLKDPPSKVPQSQFKMRTPSTPGEEYGHPYKDNIYPRRTAGELPGWMVDEMKLALHEAFREAAGAGTFPTYNERQHKQKSRAKRYYRKNYRRHKSRIRMQARRRYKRIRNSPSFKRRKSLRNKPKYHNRFRRLPAGGFRSLAERAKDEREEKKASISLPLSFYHEAWGWGDLLGFEDEGLLIHLDSDSEDCEVVPLRDFTSGMVFESEEDLDGFFDLLDQAYGNPDPRAIAATFYREVFRPGDNMDPGPGAQDLGEPSPVNQELPYPDQEHRDRAQSHDIEVYRERGDQMYGAPGSAKVIPSGYGYANKEASVGIKLYRGMSVEEFENFEKSGLLKRSPHNIGNSASEDWATALSYARNQDEGDGAYVLEIVANAAEVSEDDLYRGDYRFLKDVRPAIWKPHFIRRMNYSLRSASVQRIASAWRVAKRLAELLGETSTDVLLRAKVLRPKGKRFDQKNAMYTFSVPGATSKETYVVRMKVSRSAKTITKLGKMDLEVSCSCPFWQWQGPEHWAKVGNYLYGTPRGTASRPLIKDPTSVHKVCKHVAATLDMVKNWELPSDR